MALKLRKVGLHLWSPRSKWLFYLRNLILIGVVFIVGVGVGDGRIKLSLNSKNLKTEATGLPNQLDFNSVNAVYQVLKNNYDGQLSSSQLLDGLKHGVANSTNDPYTEYFTAQEAKNFNSQLNNSFSGIGAQLSKDKNGNLIVIAPIAGLPAAAAGVKAQDIITSINGVSTASLSIDDAVNKIRGPQATQVKLQIIRGSQTLNFDITRQNINLPSVTTKILSGNIGYVQITTFAEDTNGLMQKAADQLKAQNVKGIILDLRNNPGGLLNAAVRASSFWLQPGQKILDEKRGTQVINTETALGGNELYGIPTVVLINSGSASASEITAGALHDNGDAYLVGEKSFGKGVVQQIICITGTANANGTCSADELKVTIASWYRPNGQNINHLGITPDKTVQLSDADAASGNDTQLTAAQSYLNK